MQKLLLLIPSLFLLFFTVGFAEESNAGIVRGLWFADGTPFAGKETRIYVAIRNNTGSDLTGTIEFFDGEKKLERKQVQALDGRIIESWANWTPTYGTHTLASNLSRTQLFAVGSTTQEVEVISVSAQETVFVDFDTDSDGNGNNTDSDDDGDKVSDTEEKANGTNPLVPNTVTANDDVQVESTTPEKAKEETSPEAKTANRDTQRNEPQGLEQYLTPSRGESTLGNVTSVINTAKTKIDSYRQERAQKKESTSPKEEVGADGFGEITRTEAEDGRAFSMPSFDGAGFFDKLFNGIGKILGGLFTFVLFVFSFILGHPIFVQLGILILILFLLMRFAAKYGRRPKGYSK